MDEKKEQENLVFDDLNMDMFTDFEVGTPVEQSEDKNKKINNISELQEEEQSKSKEAESGTDEDKERPAGDASSSEELTDSPNPFSSFASVLKDEGVTPTLDLESTKIETADDLVNVIRDEIRKNEFSDLNDLQKQALEAMRNGIDLEEYKQIKSIEQQVMQITPEMLEENEELRRNVILQDFLDKGFQPERAEGLTQKIFDLSEDGAEAEAALGSIQTRYKEQVQKTIDDAKAKAKAQKDKEKKELQTLKNKVLETEEVIDGIKINETVRQNIYNSMTKVVGYDDSGRPLNALLKAKSEDPINFEIRLHYLYHITKGFTDFGKIKATEKSKAAKELEAVLRNTTVTPQSNQALDQLSVDNNDFDFGENTRIL